MLSTPGTYRNTALIAFTFVIPTLLIGLFAAGLPPLPSADFVDQVPGGIAGCSAVWIQRSLGPNVRLVVSADSIEVTNALWRHRIPFAPVSDVEEPPGMRIHLTSGDTVAVIAKPTSVLAELLSRRARASAEPLFRAFVPATTSCPRPLVRSLSPCHRKFAAILALGTVVYFLVCR